MSLNQEGIQKVARMKELVRRQYDRLSILPDAVRMEDYDPSLSHGEFLQLPYRPLLPIADFNDPNTFMDLVFGEIGRGLAFSETKFLVDHLAATLPAESVRRTPLEGILDSYTSLQNGGFEPSMVLAPVDYYMDWYDDLMIAARRLNPYTMSTTHDEKTYLMLPDGNRLRWAWSNKVSPFNEFYLMDRNCARWISKRSEEDGHRLQITITQAGDRLDVIFRLIFKLEIEAPRAVRRFIPLRAHNTPMRQ